MSEEMNLPPEANSGERIFKRSPKRWWWWLLPLVVLVILLGMIYVLVHLSASDPETYPTSWRSDFSDSRLC